MDRQDGVRLSDSAGRPVGVSGDDTESPVVLHDDGVRRVINTGTQENSLSTDTRILISQYELRALVHDMVEQELHPGMIDATAYRDVTVTDTDGRRWRGVVYAVEPEMQS